VQPFWQQPSHPSVQAVILNEAEYSSKSISKITLPPFGLFARLDFPPCTLTDQATYATVQVGPGKHLDLNSDLLFINHSCEPSLVRSARPDTCTRVTRSNPSLPSAYSQQQIFDTANMNVIAGPNGLQEGEELTVRST
jgi:hypothetical protein